MAIKKSSKTIKVTSKIQDHFITRFKQMLPPGLGAAEEMAELLNVSIDSSYRRIRGETDLTIDEIYQITKKYGISIDEVFSNQNDTVTFGYTKLTDSEANFETYLTRLYNHLVLLSKFDNNKLFYVAEEMPMFYSFFSKKLTDFKLFYWQRSVLNISSYQKIKFDWGIVPQKLVDIAHNSYKEYMKIPTSEIWTSETILTGLRQIKFYYDSGILEKEMALELFQDYKQMLLMIQKNADEARKRTSDKQETYLLYYSELVLGTNCIYAVMGDVKHSYISFNTLNSLTTNNPEFCEETEHWVKNLEKKSTLISGVGEKQRYQFFSNMYKVVDSYVEKVTLD